MKKVYMIRTVGFLLCFVIIFYYLSNVFIASDYRNYQWVRGFYEEEENTLDAVCIGSSKMYAYWNPLEAWAEYGIASYPYTTEGQPFLASEYIIKEAVKTQKDALFIVGINSIGDADSGMSSFHYLLDYMPFSLNKLRLTNHLIELANYDFSQGLELYFPLIRYHSRWNELEEIDFNNELNGLKGANEKESYLNTSVDISEQYFNTAEKAPLYKELESGINSLLNYCDEENIKILFVTVPCVETESMQINTLQQVIEDRGYPILDLRDKTEDIGIDLTKDYYNDRHTNIHGSIKFTQYLSEYLVENYNFSDKRGHENYRSWDEAEEKYWELIGNSILDFEWKSHNRDYSLQSVSDLTALSDEYGVILSWVGSPATENYAVYRKGNEEGWRQVGIVNECTYHDMEVEPAEYSYRIVPFYEKNQQIYFGNFSYDGITAVYE